MSAVELLQRYGLLQCEQVFGSPIALQGSCDLGLAPFAVLVAQLGQDMRITLATQNGPDDRHPRHAADVADDFGQLDVHLLQRLLHVLDVLASITDQHLTLTQVAAQDHNLLGGSERGAEQPITVQPLQPLAVEYIALGAARRMAGLTRIDQEHFEAPRFQQFKQGYPVDARRFHCDRRDAALRQPIGQAKEVFGASAEGTDMSRQVGRMVGRRGRCRLGGTATQWMAAWMSMPAA